VRFSCNKPASRDSSGTVTQLHTRCFEMLLVHQAQRLLEEVILEYTRVGPPDSQLWRIGSVILSL